jgi:predicted nucleic acid-binding protein
VPNKKARIPAYLLSLELSSELLDEHDKLYKKKVYSSSAQITNQHTVEELEGSLLLCVYRQI